LQEERRKKKAEDEQKKKEEREQKKREAEERLNKKGPNFVIQKRSDAEKARVSILASLFNMRSFKGHLVPLAGCQC
jgi:hypothetical protein